MVDLFDIRKDDEKKGTDDDNCHEDDDEDEDEDDCDCDEDDDEDEDDEDLDEIFGDASSSRKKKRNKLRSSDVLTDVIFESIPHNTPMVHTADVYANHHHPHPYRKPRSMHNARILGLTIFLNDVERGGGLEFPNVD